MWWMVCEMQWKVFQKLHYDNSLPWDMVNDLLWDAMNVEVTGL
jgi:hypothetical protein